MDEYLCLIVLSRSGETEAEFKSRLTAFWSVVLRSQPDEYEKVYAEASQFDRHEDKLARRYLIECVVAHALCESLDRNGLAFLTPDPDDTYSKYEAAPPEWFWIEH